MKYNLYEIAFPNYRFLSFFATQQENRPDAEFEDKDWTFIIMDVSIVKLLYLLNAVINAYING